MNVRAPRGGDDAASPWRTPAANASASSGAGEAAGRCWKLMLMALAGGLSSAISWTARQNVHSQTGRPARILWHLLKFKEPFDPEVFQAEEERMNRRKLARLQKVAHSLNDSLVPVQ
jgi:hypothetical protein